MHHGWFKTTVKLNATNYNAKIPEQSKLRLKMGFKDLVCMFSFHFMTLQDDWIRVDEPLRLDLRR